MGRLTSRMAAATSSGELGNRGGLIAATLEIAEVVTASVSETDDTSIGSPPPLLYFKTLAEACSSSSAAHFVAECRNPCCAPYAIHGRNDTDCAYLSLPSRRTAAMELRAVVEGRRAFRRDLRAQQQVKRPTKAMKEIDIDPPILGIVAPSPTSLWEFLLELLANPIYEPYIRWRDRERGQFKIRNSEVVAALWGKYKHRTNMNFDKMARAMRYYYGKKILEKGTDGGRLEYEFRSGSKWLDYVPRSIHEDTSSQPASDSDDATTTRKIARTRRSCWSSCRLTSSV